MPRLVFNPKPEMDHVFGMWIPPRSSQFPHLQNTIIMNLPKIKEAVPAFWVRFAISVFVHELTHYFQYLFIPKYNPYDICVGEYQAYTIQRIIMKYLFVGGHFDIDEAKEDAATAIIKIMKRRHEQAMMGDENV